MNENDKTLAERLATNFGDKLSNITEASGQVTIEVPVAHWTEIARELRDRETFRFEQLMDLCGVDYLGYGQTEWDTGDVSNTGFSRGIDGFGPGRFSWAERPESETFQQRFGVVVQLLSISLNQRLRMRCFAPDEGLPIVPSLVEIWNSANWYERETFDLFGIIFEGHPDLRRILTDYGFIGHPFRKDFPLVGNVTVRYDAEKERVIYEPVEIEPRVLVPRVIREDSGLQPDPVDQAADASLGEQSGEGS